jgi:hypothetical protein
MKQSNHHFRFTIPVAASNTHVWNTLIDVQNWHEWDTELISVTMPCAFEKGAKGTMKPKTGPNLKFYISELDQYQSYTINIDLPIGELVIKRSLTEMDEIIYFTDDIAFKGALKYIFGLFLGGQFRKVLPDVMANFKKIAESKCEY